MKNHIYLSVIFGIIIKGITAQEAAVLDLLSQTTCSNKTSVQAVSQTCLDIYNIAITIPSAIDLADSSPQVAVYLIGNLILNNSDVICGEQDNYTKAASCLFDISKKCNNETDTRNLIYPSESAFLQNLNKTCEAVSYITGENNHAVDIESQAKCRLGVVETDFSTSIKQCIDQNNVGIQLSDAVSLTKVADTEMLHTDLKGVIRMHTERICSNLDPFLKASNCIYYLLYQCGVGAALFTSMLSQTQIQTDYNVTCSFIERLTNVESQVATLGENLDCTDQSKVVDAQQQCFSIYNISIAMANPESIAGQTNASLKAIADLVFKHTTVICQDTEAYKMAVLCLYHILFKCGSTSTISIDSFRKGDTTPVIDNMCAILTRTSVICFRSKNAAVRQCAEYEGTTIDYSLPALTVSCRLQNKVRACEYPIVRPCGEAAVTMFENIRNSPSTCRNTPDSSLVLPNGHVHRMDCSTVKGRKDGYLDCLLYNGIYLDFPAFETHVEAIDYIMRSFTVETFTELCSDKPTYQAAINCTLAVYEECRSGSEQNLLPDFSTVASGIDSLCQKQDKFDNTCVLNADQSKCRRNTIPSTKEELCSSTATYSQCMNAAIVQSCDQETRTLYSDLLATQLPAGLCATSSTPGVTQPTKATQQTEAPQRKPKSNTVKTLASVMILLICIVVHL